jgi:hypothetical protein
MRSIAEILRRLRIGGCLELIRQALFVGRSSQAGMVLDFRVCVLPAASRVKESRKSTSHQF